MIDNVNRRERLAGHFDGWDDLHGLAAFQRGEHQQDRIFMEREAFARLLQSNEVAESDVELPSIVQRPRCRRAHHGDEVLRGRITLFEHGPHDFERVSALREIERLPLHRDTRNSVTQPSDRQT
ncbi:hypothetical protein [Methylobacterium frigidaeris]|uniref:hypothetical protein n=1 Tax=Methylobacterium frigidaeris TaxID=2038277 RepID=UPI001EDFED9B|nr:hypothetical protein [Methylobacterium frigidaeris]